MELLETTLRRFADTFGVAPTAYGVAPGRVEVLGNHTDYNDGFILSAAIDRHIVVAGRPIEGSIAKIYSHAFQVGETFDVTDPRRTSENFWTNYVEGVVDQLRKDGHPIGAFEAYIAGDIPLGSGLSSSAALEVATACFLREIYPFEMGPIDLALLCQRAENQYVGVNCGILDQFSSAMGKADHLIYLDCRDLHAFAHIPLGEAVDLVLANTKAEHELADGTYNRLREQCFEAARFFDNKLPHPVSHLRDVDGAALETHGPALPAETRARAKHVITENARVQSGVAALRSGDLASMGNAMIDSHASSRDDFGNSCEELDMMVRCALGLPGFFGCRLSGGGFGGCTVNLVEKRHAKEFAAQLAERYKSQTGIDAEIHICRAVDGARGGKR